MESPTGVEIMFFNEGLTDSQVGIQVTVTSSTDCKRL